LPIAQVPDRRRFLRAASAGLSGLLLGCRGESTLETVPDAGQPRLLPHGSPLRSIAALVNTSDTTSAFVATLTATVGQTQPLPGRATQMLLYNGMAPGPLIELREGQHVRITLDNQLGDDSTIHWHGLPVPADQDGNPMDPVKTGTTQLYEFDLPLGCAGTYWYHPHPHDLTAQQVARGLAGPLIVRARRRFSRKVESPPRGCPLHAVESNCVKFRSIQVAVCQRVWVRAMALRRVRIFRAQATRANVFGFPAATSRR